MISIHALLAESDPKQKQQKKQRRAFLSTLSLRRATYNRKTAPGRPQNFYPRSPCGERHTIQESATPVLEFLSTLSLRRATGRTVHGRPVPGISIHALLAESDFWWADIPLICVEFLSTLSLRRATRAVRTSNMALIFLSTLSLRRATQKSIRQGCGRPDFYPRSPCGERLKPSM